MHPRAATVEAVVDMLSVLAADTPQEKEATEEAMTLEVATRLEVEAAMDMTRAHTEAAKLQEEVEAILQEEEEATTAATEEVALTSALMVEATEVATILVPMEAVEADTTAATASPQHHTPRMITKTAITTKNNKG